MRRAARAVAAGAAVGALAGCGGAASPVEPADPRAPSEALLGPLEEVWSVPGYAHVNDAGTKIVVTSDEGTQLFPLARDPGEPEWEGDCNLAMFVGDSIVCGGSIIDPETGESTEFPSPGNAVYSSGGVVVVVTWEGNLVAYDADMNELWKVEGKDFAYAVEPGHLAVIDVGGSFSDVEVLDAHTGESIGTKVIPLADGTARKSEDGTFTGVDAEGEELWQIPTTASTPDPLAMVGVQSTLDDVRACLEDVELVGELAPGEQSFCVATPDGPLLALENTDRATVNVDGQQFENGWLARAFVDSAHLLIQSPPAAGGGMSLYERGVQDPVWEIPGAVGLDYNADGTLLVAVRGDSSAIFGPAD